MNNVDLVTTIRNTSGAAKYFTYLGADGRGRNLDVNGEYSFIGTWELAIRSIDAPSDRIVQYLKDFSLDLVAGNIEIVRSAAPLVTEGYGVMAIVSTGGTLSTETPSFADAGADPDDNIPVEDF